MSPGKAFNFYELTSTAQRSVSLGHADQLAVGRRCIEQRDVGLRAGVIRIYAAKAAERIDKRPARRELEPPAGDEARHAGRIGQGGRAGLLPDKLIVCTLRGGDADVRRGDFAPQPSDPAPLAGMPVIETELKPLIWKTTCLT